MIAERRRGLVGASRGQRHLHPGYVNMSPQGRAAEEGRPIGDSMTIAQAWPPRRSRRSPHGLRKISSETGSLTLAPDGIPVTSTRLFSANGLITMSGLDVGIA